MKILSLNVRCWYRDLDTSLTTHWKARAKMMENLIKAENPDVILFQELLYPASRYVPKNYEKVTCMTSHSIWVRKNTFTVLKQGWHMRYCWAHLLDKDARHINVFSVHTHWNKNIWERTLKDLKDMVSDFYINIIGGDWNNEPEDISFPAYPLQIMKTGEKTFKNWPKGDEHELDYFATFSVLHPSSIVGPWVVDAPASISDHKPIAIIYDGKA